MRNNSRSLRMECLENRTMLAIDWINQGAIGNDIDDFEVHYGQENAVLARSIVNRAIDDWNSVITDQDFDNDNDAETNDFQLEVFADDLGGGGRGQANITGITDGGVGQAGWDTGVPMSATVTLDDNGGNIGWFFDETPLDDAEFTGIADTFQSSFVDATAMGQQHINDFYRTITHEIGHALGISFQDSDLAIFPHLFFFDSNGNGFTEIDTNPVASGGGDPLVGFYSSLPASGLPDAVLTQSGGGHFYEGGPNDAPQTPTHPNQLMNPGRTVPAGQPTVTPPVETTRQFISDLTVEVLEDAYGYTVTLPSELDTAHATLDTYTGTLLVQGLPGAQNDDIDISVDGTDILVEVNDTEERVPLDQVTQILIAENGGTDTVNVAPALMALRQDIDYVVSSNEDAVDANLADNVFDLDAVVPGNQVSLRGAIQNANGDPSAAIYVPPMQNSYQLTRTGAEASNASVNDLDITGDVTIIGAGAGRTVIDAGGLGTPNGHTRAFQISGSGRSLNLSRVTLTGGDTTSGGGAIIISGGGELTLAESALTGNHAAQNGSALRNIGSTVSIFDSVLAGNTSDLNTGALASSGTGVALSLGSSVFAQNTYDTGSGPIERDVLIGAGSNLNYGNNLVSSSTGATAFFNTDLGDTIGAAVDHVVTSLADVLDDTDDPYALSLREAVEEANDTDGTIWAPAWHFLLTILPLTETNFGHYDNLQGDFNIEGDVTLQGVGPGFTVIDGSLLGQCIIRLDGTHADTPLLNLSRMTVMGSETDSSGAGIHVRYGGTLNLSETVIVSNHSTTSGGGLRLVSSGSDISTATIDKSVFTLNQAGIVGQPGTGGAIFAGGGSQLTIKDSVFAHNIATSSTNFNNVRSVSGSQVTSLGGNLVDDTINGSPGSTVFTHGTDQVLDSDEAVVVTSARDRFSAIDDFYALSLREAVDAANINNVHGEAQALDEIWLAPWDFVLTKDRGTNPTDTDAAIGDLDISESLLVRGSGNVSSSNFKWREGEDDDKVFDLLGDYDGNGVADNVDGNDFLVWQTQNGSGSGTSADWEDYSADGDDDGDVDGDDLDIWNEHYGNTFAIV